MKVDVEFLNIKLLAWEGGEGVRVLDDKVEVGEEGDCVSGDREKADSLMGESVCGDTILGAMEVGDADMGDNDGGETYFDDEIDGATNLGDVAMRLGDVEDNTTTLSGTEAGRAEAAGENVERGAAGDGVL